MNADERRSLVRAGSFLLIAVAEKLTVLHLPPHWLRGVIHIFNGAPAGFGLAVLLFGWNRLKAFRVEESIERLPAALHIVLLSALIALQHWYPHGYAAPAATGGLLLAAAIAWTALIPLIILTLLLSFVPLHHLGSLVRALAPASLYAAASTAALLVLRSAGDTAWRRSSVGVVHLIQQASFEQTRLLLQRFYPFVISIPDKHILGTPRYLIEISWLCSGIEGLLLVALAVQYFVNGFVDLHVLDKPAGY